MRFLLSTRRALRGFSLVEVIMALGVMSIAVISVLGLIGPALGTVKDAQNINAGTACISKMNSLIQSSPFWTGDAVTQGECVWRWVALSGSDSPTVFLFYDEIPVATGADASTTPLQRVVRFNVHAAGDPINTPLTTFATNTPDAAVPQLPLMEKMDSFLAAVNESRISGPVIAMTLSLSPFVKNFPKKGLDDDETKYYVPPAPTLLNGLFPGTPEFGGLMADPDGAIAGKPYPEAYLPIYIQAFSVPISNLQNTTDTAVFEGNVLGSFSLNTRLFTYTTAKLR